MYLSACEVHVLGATWRPMMRGEGQSVKFWGEHEETWTEGPEESWWTSHGRSTWCIKAQEYMKMEDEDDVGQVE